VFYGDGCCWKILELPFTTKRGQIIWVPTSSNPLVEERIEINYFDEYFHDDEIIVRFQGLMMVKKH